MQRFDKYKGHCAEKREKAAQNGDKSGDLPTHDKFEAFVE
jgi:hypothetical protein